MLFIALAWLPAIGLAPMVRVAATQMPFKAILGALKGLILL